MSIPSDPHQELERRYRRLLRLFPAHYRRAWEEELIAVLLQLLQAAHPGRRQVQHTAVSPDRNANHRGAAILTVTLPLLLLFPAAKAGAEQLIYGSSSWWHHYDLIAWAIWIPAAVATAFGPARIAHWIAGLGTLAYALFLITPVMVGDTGTLSTSFGWLLIQFTAWRLLTSPARGEAGSPAAVARSPGVPRCGGVGVLRRRRTLCPDLLPRPHRPVLRGLDHRTGRVRNSGPADPGRAGPGHRRQRPVRRVHRRPRLVDRNRRCRPPAAEHQPPDRQLTDLVAAATRPGVGDLPDHRSRGFPQHHQTVNPRRHTARTLVPALSLHGVNRVQCGSGTATSRNRWHECW